MTDELKEMWARVEEAAKAKYGPNASVSLEQKPDGTWEAAVVIIPSTELDA